MASILMVKSFQKANASKGDTTLIEYYNSGSMPNGGGICLIVFAIAFILGSIIGIPVMSSSIAQWIIIPEFKIAKEISYLIQTI
jgi:putative exporter of polyketide antibiotics